MIDTNPGFAAYKAFMNAMTFHLAAQRCAEDRELEGGGAERLMLPLTVNLAFSIELYIKAIIITRSGTSPWGHELHKLVAEMDDGDRRAVKNIFKEIDHCEHDFDEFLVAETLAFNSWRYSHEAASVSSRTIFLNRLAISLLRHGEVTVVGDFGGLNRRVHRSSI